MEKRIEAMQEYINKAFGAIQRLDIKATESNTGAVTEALGALRIVYNTLGVMKQEQLEQKETEQPVEEEAQDGQVPEAE